MDILAPYYEMHSLIREEQEKYKERVHLLKDKNEKKNENEDKDKKQILEKGPLILNSDINFSELTSLFLSILEIYSRFSGRKEGNSKYLPSEIEKLVFSFSDILEEFLYLRGEKHLEKHVSNFFTRETLVFLIKNTLLPLLEKHLDFHFPNSSIDLDCWGKGYCPVCGHLPGLAEFKKRSGGYERFLICSLCHTSWVFERFLCPFCKKSEEDGLEYFSFPEEENYRIYTCKSCKSFIKTIIDKPEDMSHVLLDWSSLYIDTAVLQKGYKKPVSM